MDKLKTNFLNVELKNPVITSSGCFGFGGEYKDYFDVNELGAVTLKGLTLKPRDGNYGVRIAETASGMLNCIGLENPGIDFFITHIMKDINFSTPIIININADSISDYIEIAEIADTIDKVDFVELNISCPNVKNGGMVFGADQNIAREAVRAVRKVLTKPLIVKLSPNVTDIVSIAKVSEDNGADAVSLVNTFLGMAIDVKTKRPILGNVFGGLSGPCIKPIALRMVYQVYKALSIPIIAMGGIENVNDALEFIMAGASLISVGSGIFSNPLLPIEIINGIKKYLDDNDIENVKDIIGIAQ